MAIIVLNNWCYVSTTMNETWLHLALTNSYKLRSSQIKLTDLQ